MSFTTIKFVKDQNLRNLKKWVLGVFGADNNKDFIVRELETF